MKLCVLGSGSKGNALCLWNDGGGLLIDCGLSYRQTILRMHQRRIEPGWFDAVLLSHKHASDHALGLPLWCRRQGIRSKGAPYVYCTEPTAEGLDALNARDHRSIGVRDVFQVAGFTVKTRPLIHNAEGACTFFVHEQRSGVNFSLLYETGRLTMELIASAERSDVIAIEANYDPVMLANNEKLPIEIMERIAATHLSNNAAARYLETVDQRVRLVILLHLSRDNNTPELASEIAQAALDKAGSQARLVVAEQDSPSEVLEI